ncbi:uncharacterized protein AC631_03495 [Debaryomyces fabryi]|uniref:Cytochrome b5 heme-binding domain-containing protein n=1 Tax=Debaryomyces fabryi TaxID=58627 RepID=A0A0V1PXC8_9ASCO|nr:uncharacterized protein AC631_03495 [Debaryomyces fabryi]KSA00725.1 hypothetical protein AC631_03495 [Debaryomyces fabryi]CUM47112.1 unnamed protein product [Debaryomyces fabryi]
MKKSTRGLKSQQHDNVKFGIIDILQIIGGLIFLNAFLSWWFTSTSTWGYKGKWIDSEYLKLRITNNYVNLTIDELSLYNGSDPKLPVYIGINGKVYDVSRSRGVYGPEGTYGFFSGKDAARAFVTGCFSKQDEFTYDLRGLDPDEAMHDIESWQRFFETNSKYWYVGIVQHEDLVGEPPSPCDHMKFPTYYNH